MKKDEHSFFSRRTLLKGGLASAVSAGLLSIPNKAWALSLLDQGFENGIRELVPYPQKYPLLRITTRPVHLETPFSYFDQSLITPNKAVFVRYHLANHPLNIDESAHILSIKGNVNHPLKLSIADLKQRFNQVSFNVVLQCAGNGRALFSPRVPGAQLGNGSMACFKVTGVRLADVLKAAGIGPNARQIKYRGLDEPALPVTPAFIRALDIDKALSEHVLIAWAMNGEPLPMLNGFPIRLVVPGYFAPYWMKHLSEIEVINTEFDGWFAKEAYMVPDTENNGIAPNTPIKNKIPLTKLKVRSFITNIENGKKIKLNNGELTLRGIAFDCGSGIRAVDCSADGGKTWLPAALGKNIGHYAFRPWIITLKQLKNGPVNLMARATANSGETQPLEQPWNPGGYARNVVERVHAQLES
ncbi:molybdopterin-dependent oxidoreductase [Iodobacter fluviatilis]|uniref:Sulfite dehydrogenase (Cytochrome) subunit SorA apoprotein n=1 Tax=Iodobacter fluviatilis TaxID=537 RepID=A0A377Q7N7_9NEIS|nr:molybdopterin-dependent oxidoreductase [Iodobacter fluviatilis]TCU89477.1 sulfite dehydrogenase (cytochrome) subunit SorA apoprotein [Iodobacter fluviatilis]STQ90847.1 TMAO/DMSO reductase [Iodobacter fluviatilis]